MKTRLSHLAGAALSMLFIPSAACRAERPRAAGPTAAATPRPVATVAVERASGARRTVPAAVRARRRAALSSRIPAAVIALPFREGDRVAAGSVVARLDDAALRSAVSAAEAARAAAEADRLRMDSLLAKGAATPRERDESTARAAQAAAALAGANDDLAYAALRAPFAGRVGARPVSVGDVVGPGRTLIEIEGDDGYEVVADVDADLAAAVRPGSTLAVEMDTVRAPLSATVAAVSPAGDPATHRFELRADLAPAEGVRSGLFARLAIPSPGQEARLTLPSGAVFARGGLRGVFVVTEGRARLRWIAVGTEGGDTTEVRAGLAAGERVVLDPNALEDGLPVAEAR